MKQSRISKGLIDEICVDLKLNHCGKDNGVKRSAYALEHGLTERELRKITQTINESDEYNCVISTSCCIYVCATQKECEQAVRTAFRTAITQINKARKMKEKLMRNGQLVVDVEEEVLRELKTYEQ